MSDTRWKTKQHRVIFILTEELIQEKQAGREITKSLRALALNSKQRLPINTDV